MTPGDIRVQEPIAPLTIPLKLLSPQSSSGSLQLSPDQITLKFPQLLTPTYSVQQLVGWEFCAPYAALAFSTASGEQSFFFQGEPQEILTLQRELNAVRCHLLIEKSEHQGALPPQFERCPVCSLDSPVQDLSPLQTHYCPECASLWRGEDLLSSYKNQPFDFSRSGLFCMIGMEDRRSKGFFESRGGEGFHSLFTEVRSGVERLVGQLLWAGLFVLLYSLVWYGRSRSWFPSGSIPWTQGLLYLFFAAASFNFVMLGYYGARLMMTGSLRLWMRPPLIEEHALLIRRDRLEEAELWLKQNKMQDHPGLVSNMGMGYLWRGQKEEAQRWFQRALALCPHHPALQAFALKDAEVAPSASEEEDRPLNKSFPSH